MTSPAGAGQPGDARRTVAQLAGRRADRAEPPAPQLGEQADWFAADPPTNPLPAVPASVVAASAVPASGAPPADEASPPTVSGGLRALRSLWAPRTSRAKSAPLAVRRSYRWWLVAMVVGVAAVVVSVVAAWHYQQRTGVSLAGGTGPGTVLTELGGLLLASIAVARLRAGDDWARTALALVGGLVALLSALTAAGNISFVASTPAYFRTAEALFRLAQAAAVGLGIWYMFQPGAARHFDPRRGA